MAAAAAVAVSAAAAAAAAALAWQAAHRVCCRCLRVPASVAHAASPLTAPALCSSQLEGIKYTRKNEVRPFEPGGEASLEFYAQRSDCALVALGSHSKKRPHNLVLARLFDGHLLDQLELGVTASSSIASFGAAASETQLGNKVCHHPCQ